MAERANQHYVPQFYFRQFTFGERNIHALLTKTGRLIFNASIKGQCAGHNFYGSKDLESLYSKLEARHRAAFAHLMEIAWSESPPNLTPENVAFL